MKKLIEDIKLNRVVDDLLNKSHVNKSIKIDTYHTEEFNVFMRVHHELKLVRVNNRTLKNEYNITFDDRIQKMISDFYDLDDLHEFESYDPYIVM